MNILFSFIIASGLAYHGIRKKSLSNSGAFTAFLLGFSTFLNEWSVFPVIMLVFYFTSSKLTKVKFNIYKYEYLIVLKTKRIE